MAYLETAAVGGSTRPGLAGSLSHLFHAIRDWSRRRQARVALLSLSDYYLADIGLTRGQIERDHY